MIATYDPSLQILDFGGIILTGFAEGTFITVERDEDAYSKYAGADGTPARIRSRNRLGSFTVSLMQSSPSNDQLMQIALLDDPEVPGSIGLGVRPILMTELNGTTTAASASAWIRKIPRIDRAKDFSPVEWIFDCGVLRQWVGGLAPL